MMERVLRCGVLVLIGLHWCCGDPGWSADPSGYPEALREEIRSLLAAGADRSTDPVFLLRLAELYLSAGDDLYEDTAQRIRMYEEGAKVARRALELQDLDPEAHYLYAANLGSAAQLKGVMASALVVRDLKRHTRRALELDADHAPALHMMGMMLEELPGLLGGDKAEALVYLERAVTADPTYTHARLNLAKAYLERDRFSDAEAQLRAIVHMRDPRHAYAWARRHQPEARRLLESLANRG